MIPFRTNRIWALGVVLFLVSSTEAWCQAADQTMQARQSPLAIYIASGIDQTQQDKMKVLLQDFERLTLSKAPVMIQLMREMRAISVQVDANEKLALAKQDEINNLNNEMASERIRLMFKLSLIHI